MDELDEHVKETLKQRAMAIEDAMDGDVVFYYGPIFPGVQQKFRDFIEGLRSETEVRTRLIVFLETPGGSAETVEKLVEIIRHHYEDVYFVVPGAAMSAGTIFCMSGDRIYMDYTSSLGPIDPQVFNGRDWVPALGYLEQVERMVDRSARGLLTDAELVILQHQDLAMLSALEQAKTLTISLLKKWLVAYKFKDWNTHESNPALKGQVVTMSEKVTRAEEIATALSDHKIWHSHGRMIGLATLRDQLRLRTEDYSRDVQLRTVVRKYHDLLVEYLVRHDFKQFLHSRSYF